jgi:hypothetical protein
VTSATVITRRVIEALNRAGIPHMLVGAFSRNAYAPPRSTYDADIVVALAGGSLRSVVDVLGADFKLESQAGFETNTGTLRDTLVHTDAQFSVELFHLSQDAHDQERFGRRRATSFDGEQTCIPTPEDVIITKLRWARRKDLDDVGDILRFVEAASLDWDYLHRWVGVHGTRAALDALRGEASASDR